MERIESNLSLKEPGVATFSLFLLLLLVVRSFHICCLLVLFVQVAYKPSKKVALINAYFSWVFPVVCCLMRARVVIVSLLRFGDTRMCFL